MSRCGRAWCREEHAIELGGFLVAVSHEGPHRHVQGGGDEIVVSAHALDDSAGQVTMRVLGVDGEPCVIVTVSGPEACQLAGALVESADDVMPPRWVA